MKARLIILIAAAIGSLNVSMAQKQINDEILKFKDCFTQFSNPAVHENSYNVNGKQVPVIEKTDFATKQFAQVDPQLNNVKLMLLDNRDLSSWERTNARTICESYFADGQPGFHIAAHGLQDPEDGDKVKVGGKFLNPEETADLIMQTLNDFDIILDAEKKPFPIVLHTCKSGNGGENSFAAKLSSILTEKISNVAVIASPDIVRCTIDGNDYNEYVETRHGKGNWLVFQNGKQTLTGTTDYKSTVNAYLNAKQNGQ
jgi:hypothetical protein